MNKGFKLFKMKVYWLPIDCEDKVEALSKIKVVENDMRVVIDEIESFDKPLETLVGREVDDMRCVGYDIREVGFGYLPEVTTIYSQSLDEYNAIVQEAKDALTKEVEDETNVEE